MDALQASTRLQKLVYSCRSLILIQFIIGKKDLHECERVLICKATTTGTNDNECQNVNHQKEMKKQNRHQYEKWYTIYIINSIKFLMSQSTISS